MATIKQIKIGTTNYDLKALNAANQVTDAAVVRDIQYGTAAPSGGSNGQVYLKYDDSNTNNLYVYAEDTVGTTASIVDNYYSKNEVDNLLQDKIVVYEYGSTAINSGYCIINYPSGVTHTYYHLPIIQPKYIPGSDPASSTSIMGWIGQVQPQTDTTCVLYVRRGTESLPPNGSHISFIAYFIRR